MKSPDPLIHAPARLELMTLLNAAATADFIYLLRETGLTKGNLAAHLAKLEAAGYVSIEKTYRGRVPLTRYRITPAGQGALRAYRQHLLGVMKRLEPSEG
jgi:DNA-binding MarR family transcriptional regulator